VSQAKPSKKRLVVILGLSIFISIFIACGQGRQDLRVIQHVVFIVKENRTFDHYFGTFPGADGATTGIVSTGQVVPLTHPDPSQLDNLCNGWDCAIEAVDGGKMDKFDLIIGGSLNAYTQFGEQDIPNYWAYPNMLKIKVLRTSTPRKIPQYPLSKRRADAEKMIVRTKPRSKNCCFK